MNGVAGYRFDALAQRLGVADAQAALPQSAYQTEAECCLTHVALRSDYI